MMSRVTVLLACALLSSCATRIYCDDDAPRLPKVAAAKTTETDSPSQVGRYVIGQRAADGFQIESVVAIKPRGICGMGLMRTIFTFGLIPAELPHPSDVTVTGRLGSTAQTRTYLVHLHTWTSLFHGLVPASGDSRAIARGLLAAIASSSPLPPPGQLTKHP